MPREPGTERRRPAWGHDSIRSPSRWARLGRQQRGPFLYHSPPCPAVVRPARRLQRAAGGGCHCRAATRREPPGGRPRATCTGLTRAGGSVSVRNPPRSTYASKHVLGTSPPLLAPYYFPSNCSGHYIFLITAGISRADTIFLGTRRDDGKTCIRLSGSSLCPSRSQNAMLTRIVIDFVMSRTSHI